MQSIQSLVQRSGGNNWWVLFSINETVFGSLRNDAKKIRTHGTREQDRDSDESASAASQIKLIF